MSLRNFRPKHVLKVLLLGGLNQMILRDRRRFRCLFSQQKRLPWLGKVSMAFKNQICTTTICTTTKNAVPTCKPIYCFTSGQMFSTSKKNVLSAEKISNVMSLFKCECGHRYVGKTTRRMEERVKQCPE